MTRKKMVFDPSAIAGHAGPRNIRVPADIASQIKASKAVSGLSWQDWATAAVHRLQQESCIEIKSLAKQADLVAISRRNIEQLPLRIKNSDMAAVHKMAFQYNTSTQSILIAALHLYSFASGVTPPSVTTTNSKEIES